MTQKSSQESFGLYYEDEDSYDVYLGSGVWVSFTGGQARARKAQVEALLEAAMSLAADP